MYKSLILLRKNLREFLDSRDWSQKKLASEMNHSPTSLNRVFTTDTDFQISMLDKIAEALKIETYELLLPEQPKESPTISSLAKTIEQQATLLDGNEELLELWNKLDEDHKEVLLKQLRNLTQKESQKKSKA